MISYVVNSKLIIRLLIGIFQGLALFLIKLAWLNHFWTFGNRSFSLTLGCLLVFIPPIVVLGWENIRAKTLFLWSLGAAAILSIFTVYCLKQTFVSYVFLICIFILLFIAHSLVTAGDQQGRMRANYNAYFDISWKLAVQLVLAGVFTAIFWGLLFLGSYLFILLGSYSFFHLILNSSFAYPASTLAFSAALHLTDVRVKWVRGIRTVILTLFSWLLPMITLILIGFFIFLIKTGIESFRQQDHSLLALMISMSVLVLLINTVYQDGSPKRLAPRFLQITLQIAIVLLIPLVGLGTFFLIKLVAVEGWTDYRILTVAYLFIMAVYALGYLSALLFNPRRLKLLESVNFYAAWSILLVITALLTPIANPHHLLHVKSELPKPVEPKQFKTKTISVHTGDKKLPDSFINVDWYTKNPDSPWEIPGCLKTADLSCDAWEVQFDHSGRKGILIFENDRFYGFIEASANNWEVMGTWESLPFQCASAAAEAKTGKFQFIPPEPQVFSDIQVQGQRLRFNPHYQLPKCKV